MAGIQPRINLLSLDLKHICQSVENSPWVKRAKIKRILPDQLEISIIEREAVALINLNQLYLIDKKGTIFKRVEKEDGFVLPVLTGVTWKNLMNHQNIYAPLITQALTVMDLFKEEGIPLATTSEIHLDVIFGLTVFTTHHATQIEMGSPPFRQKCKRLYIILHDLERKNLIPQTIDLNYSNKAFVKSTPRHETIKPIKKGGENQWGKMEI
jgi:cell division protein FtsQ